MMSIFDMNICPSCKKSVGYLKEEKCVSCTINEYYTIKPKEETKMNNDQLKVAQESANNAFMAIQGIISAHQQKNGEEVTPKRDNVKDMFINEGIALLVKGNLAIGIHPNNVENNIEALIDGRLSFDWEAIKEDYLDTEGSDANYIVTTTKETPFTFSDFDKSVQRTWKKQSFKDAVSNAALGLTGEAGEVADLIKKAVYHGRGFRGSFDDHDHINHSGEISRMDVKDELSDTLFYVSAMAQEFGFTLEDIARHNKEKLEKRYKEGFTTEESAEKRDKYESN